MKLTRKMKIEINSMQHNLEHLNELNHKHLQGNTQLKEEIIRELEACKIKLEHMFYKIDDKQEKIQLLRKLHYFESTFNRHKLYKYNPDKCYISDDSDRYAQMGLQIEPKDSLFNALHGAYLRNLQDEFFEETTPSTEWDYTFIDYQRKAYENENSNMLFKHNLLMTLRKAEARRDYYNGMIKEIKHLEQFDQTPNIELKEPKWEIYKITINGSFQCDNAHILEPPLTSNPNCGDTYCNHRVLFQNEDGNINMGAWFNDPVNEVYDIHWFGVLELEMDTSVIKNEGLIIDKDFNTRSCFVELHRNGFCHYNNQILGL